jgi:pyruvate/2-oxoglutarate dehydrogenase complex dihydrolipoamide dehydrogenase (E3) component
MVDDLPREPARQGAGTGQALSLEPAPVAPLPEPWDVHDRALVGHVRPPDWVNPRPASRYDLVAIGGGTAGLVSAIGAAALGARVALVERGLLGGDCLNTGCVPSKALLRAARAVADARAAAEDGILPDGAGRVAFGAVMARVRRLRARIAAHDAAARCRDLGVDVFLAPGRFAGPDTVLAGGATLRFARAVIATGARAAVPPIPGLAEVPFLTSETVFALTERPRRLAVIGGGPLGCELAQAFARLGAAVTLLQRNRRILPREDEDAGHCLGRALAQDGVRVVTACQIQAVEARAGGARLRVAHPGHAEAVDVDTILVASGRTPNVEGLGLEAAGIRWDAAAGVVVDDRLRSTNPRVYAAGDVCSTERFTHHAHFQARLVIRNALFGGRARASRLTIPRCTYTDPEIAHVGLSARDAARRGVAVQTFEQPLAEVDRAILDGDTEGFVRIHVQPGTDRILGATVVARHAGDLLSEITVAMVNRVGLGRIGQTIHPYPTTAEAIRALGDQHLRTRLRPWVRRLLAAWLWCRR